MIVILYSMENIFWIYQVKYKQLIFSIYLKIIYNIHNE